MKFVFFTLVFLSPLYGFCQQAPSSDGAYALPENLVPRPDDFPGFPNDTDDQNLKANFKNPPHGYGEVPFYWWTGGDKLTRERLLWQLDQLSEAGVLGLSVSYNHTSTRVDTVLNKGANVRFGVAEASDPPFLSEEWWDIWNWFSDECGKRNMGLGLDDYVLGDKGEGNWASKLAENPELMAYQGRLKVHDPITFEQGRQQQIIVPNTVLAVAAYVGTGDVYDGEGSLNLLPLAKGNVINWKPPSTENWTVIMISTENGYMLHPDHGNLLVYEYFQKFEDHLSPEARKGMNFFFQDELVVDIDEHTWSEDFVAIFLEKKGYDIRPLLPALYFDIGNKTPKVRLDYYDVMIELAEKRYFKPVFEWHWQRGMMMGCDNEGRGTRPEEYGDYFRAIRWFGAPGNDAPGSGYSFIQTKVSSSIAHLYKRPRVWLEAYHSLGWNAQPSWIHFSTNKHFQFGGNLLCLHGLYYTTHGGWWEWAPPDFHFRMPYWPHFSHWLKNAERLSYLLSQGLHRCDVAILYPVAPLQAKNGGTKEVAFAAGETLYNQGIDFDFIDFQSVNRSIIDEGRLIVSDEEYQALILADMTAIHFSTLEKALMLFENGGVVIGVGKLPMASDRVGAADPRMDDILETIFGYTAAEAGNLSKPIVHKGKGTGIYYPSVDQNMAAFISPHIKRDFIPESEKGSVLHRKIGAHDVFQVMDIPKGTSCFFRATGKPELLDPATGDMREIEITRQTDGGTYLDLPRGIEEASMIMFSPGEANLKATDSGKQNPGTLPIQGIWESELVPTLDNQWGDFRLPASDDKIGAEARTFRYMMLDNPSKKLTKAIADDSQWPTVTYSFGPRLWKLMVPEKEAESITAPVLSGAEEFLVTGSKVLWEPYEYSLRQGVENQPGSQGYHGLKGKVSDNFLIMDHPGGYYFKTFVYSKENVTIEVHTSGKKPDGLWINGRQPGTNSAQLEKGNNTLILYYNNTGSGKLMNQGAHFEDTRTRSAVALMDEGVNMHQAEPLSMVWYEQPGIKTFDLYEGKSKTGYYRFDAPPGLESMQLKVYGTINAYHNGEKLDVQINNTATDGLQDCLIPIKKVTGAMSSVCFEIAHQQGAYGGSAIPEPVKLQCGKGEIQTGDWSEMGALKSYSGGMWYRKTIRLDKAMIARDLYLDLGDICATAEVHINGKQAGICMTKPFRLNIREYVKEGDNRLEILVYSTLSNHYTTIPTPPHYKQSFEAGLIGPVRIVWE